MDSKRTFDLLICVVAAIAAISPFLLIWLAVKITSSGPAFYWSKRVGKFNQHFMMPKFRTMRIGTPEVATHLLNNPDSHLTPIGPFLRKTSLDELPQLWSIL